MIIKTYIAKLRKSPKTTLFFIWILATLININKPFHIDDTFHLEAAKWLQHNPLQPMSGSINWDNISEPIYHFNQPPGYFYLIAVVGSIFGFSEISLHIFQSIFTLLAIIYFYKLLYLLHKRFALVGTTLLALGPAFIVNQNIMIDIPILSLSIIFIYLLIKEDTVNLKRNMYFAATILSVGLIFKYSLLPLLLVLIYAIWVKKRIDLTQVLVVPITILTAWTIFNYMEFGNSHMVGRPRNDITLSLFFNHSVTFLLTLGGVVPFSPLFISGFFKSETQRVNLAVVITTILVVAVSYLLVYGFSIKSLPYSLFWIIFFGNGLLIVILFILTARRRLTDSVTGIIVVWLLSTSLFFILYAPFMATRHVLLILPPLIILVAYVYEFASSRIAALSLGLTIFLGVVLGISDYVYANFYKKAAAQALMYVPENKTVWTLGHWGWQWYSKEAGMTFYETDRSELQEGDYLVSPEAVYKQEFTAKPIMTKVATINYEPSIWNFFTTAHHARFYNSYVSTIPWYVSATPVDSVSIYIITKP